MIVNIIIPIDESPTLRGFHEIAQSELAAIFKKLNWEVIESEEGSDASKIEGDLIILIAQYQYDVSGKFVQGFKKNTNAVVCVFGRAVTAARFYILAKNPDIDIVLYGEPELTLIEIAKFMSEKNPDFSGICGTTVRKNGKIVDNPTRGICENYDDFPFPTFSFLEKGKQTYPICILSSSKGCHGKCTFCEGYASRRYTHGSVYRAKSAERVVDEIEYAIGKFGYRIFSFIDDNFFVDGNLGIERAFKIAELIKRKNLRFRFTIDGRADNITEGIAKALKSCGLHKVYIGVESGSDYVLGRYVKEVTVEQNARALEILAEHNILCEPGYIWFDPQTTKKELTDTYHFFAGYAHILYSHPHRLAHFRLSIIEEKILKNSWDFHDYDPTYLDSVNIDAYPYKTEEAEYLYNKFIHLYQTTLRNPHENELQYRLRCLNELLRSRIGSS